MSTTTGSDSAAGPEFADLDAPVRTLFEQIGAAAAATPSPDLEAIGQALSELAKQVDYLSSWVKRLGNTSGALKMHAPERGPRLQIVHRLEAQMGAIHDHRTWVAAAPIVGLETHRHYRIIGSGPSARPELAEEVELDPADHVTMLPPDDFHSHGHVAGRGSPSYVLILTGDDQTRFERTEWDLATGRHRTLNPGDRGRWLDSEPMP